MPRLLLLLTLVCPSVSAFAACTFDLLPPVHHATGQDTRNFVVAKLNGDAFYDVALRVEGTDKIVVMLGLPGGGFGEPSTFSIGRNIRFDLEAGDFNGDGIQDLVATDSWHHDAGLRPVLMVLLGKGDGTFQPPILKDVFQNPNHLTFADFNHDGKLDVATAKASAFELLLGQGDGTLVAETTVWLLPESNATFETQGIIQGDFDADGELDVAVSEVFSNNIHVFFGRGDALFDRGPVLPLVGGFWALRMTSGDYDGDGDTDIAYGQYHTLVPGDREMILYRSNGGARTFQDAAGYGTLPGGSFDAQSADMDGDGDLDILLACISDVTVMFNDGHGAFPTQESYGNDGFEAKAADIDGDGGLDLVVSGFNTDQVSVFRNFCGRVGLDLTSSPNPSMANSNVTFTGTVIPPAAPVPTGTLTLKRGDNVIATGDLAASLTLSKTLNTLAAGTYNITAIYSGDASFKPETKTIEHVVELPPFGAPANLTAFSTGGPVLVKWTGTKGVEHYEVWRRGAGAGWALLTTTPNQAFSDATASPSAAWLYKVRGISATAGTPSIFSNVDLASTFSFTDETITVGVTKVKRTHVTQLRGAVDAARAAAGLGAASWTDAVPAVVKAAHFNELGTALDHARMAAGMPAGGLASAVTGTSVKALHLTQLRDALR